MFVKPVEGRVVRDPFSLVPIPAEGREVPEDTYWSGRVRDGDLVKSDPPKAAPAAKPAKE